MHVLYICWTNLFFLTGIGFLQTGPDDDEEDYPVQESFIQLDIKCAPIPQVASQPSKVLSSILERVVVAVGEMPHRKRDSRDATRYHRQRFPLIRKREIMRLDWQAMRGTALGLRACFTAANVLVMR